MRLVRLSDLSEDERKKALEEQQERINKNRQEAQNIQNEANQKFNDYVTQHGSYDTNKHTTTIGDLKKAYKNTPSYNNIKTSTNELYKNNKASIWEQVQSIANGLGKNVQNVGLGINNGINYFRQQLERSTRNNSFNNAVNMNNEFLQEQLNKNPNDEKAKSMLEQNNKYINNMKNNQDNYQNKLKEKINNNNEKIQKNIDTINNPILKKTAELAPSIGQMIPGFVPGAGIVYMTGSASGQYYEDAKQRGMNDEEAQKYSGIMGLMEGATEMIGIENLSKAGKGVKALVKGTGKETLKQGTKEITKSSIKSVLKDYGIGIADNVMQEAIIDPIQELTAQTIAGKDKAQWDGIGQKMLQDGINGGLVSAILGGANLGIQSCTGVVEKLHNNQQITGQEIQKAVKDASQQLDTSKMMVDSVEQQVNKYKDYYTGKELDNNSQNVLNEAQNIINNNQNLQSNVTKNQLKTQEQQIISVENKTANNGNIGQNIENNLQKSYNDLKIGENTKVPIETILNIQDSSSGYRTQEQINNLRNDIITNGITTPIEIYRKNDGTFAIENGNHRIKIAQELGIKDIPVKLVESWESIGLPKENVSKIDSNKLEGKYNERDSREISRTNENSWNRKGSMYNDNVQSQNNRTTEKNAKFYETKSNSNEFTGSEGSKENNRSQGLEKSSSFNLPIKEDTKTKLNLPIKENINTKGESINWNEIERPDGKIRKHYRSIIESNNTTKEAKSIAKQLMGTDTYVPETNKAQLVQADTRINNSSPEVELKSLMNRVTTGGKIEAVDIAVGERLIQYYSKTGDKANLQEAIQATAMAGTSAGQTVQALAMLNHQTPEGQATWIQRSVDKMNNELVKKKGGTITKDSDGNVKVINKQGKDITDKVDLFNLTPDMIEKITNSKDKETMYKNIDSVYEELGNQVPKSTIEKIDSWRYFSMLANPRTHIRNMVGNVAMGKTQRVKDKLAGGIEDIASKFNPNMERTKTIAFSDKKTKEFAKNDFNNIDVQSRLELNENKYNPQSRLQNARRTFKSEIMEKTLGKLFDLNDNLLEAEDGLGLKSAYQKALSDYITANKINVDNITDKQLGNARNYAIEQAKEATFHQANSIATAINQFSRKNKLTKGTTDAILPFVKTPMNVAKAGLEYNPVGLLKTITTDTVKLRKGNITVNKYIDNLSKGLTGTGIAVLGYALADAGILKASGGDDNKKENYDEALGKQAYSIQISGKTYSLDWLAPVGIPLFTGAEAYSIKNSNQNEKSSISSDDNKKSNQLIQSLENWANGMAKSISPMSEMSMISGLTSALSSYSEDKLSAMGTNAVKSYVNQFVPTLLGQTAKTADDYERSTTSTKTGLLPKAIDQTKLQMMSKIPGLRQKLPTKSDIWGNEQKSEPNIPKRMLNNFVNPATVKNIDMSKVDEELNKLYDKIGEATILPSTIDKTYTINGQIYRMTNDEYAKYKKEYGQTSYKLLNGLINSEDYNNLNEEQKQKAIENVYSYAKEKNKIDYASNKNEILKTSTLYDTLEELEQKGGEQSSYLGYIAKTKDITGEGANKQKIEILANSNYSDNTKEIIYKNTEGSKDKKIILVDKLGLPINEYLRYKANTFDNDKDSDGETISGSKKKKVYNYLDSISNKNLSQNYKKIICKIEGINDYDNDIVNFVNNSKQLNYDERTEILKDIGFKIDKNGEIQTKSMIPIYKYVK